MNLCQANVRLPLVEATDILKSKMKSFIGEYH